LYHFLLFDHCSYLNWSWGVGEAYHRYLAFQQRKSSHPANVPGAKRNSKKTVAANSSKHPACNTCVITNRDAARKRFTAKAMFVSFRVQQLAELKPVYGIKKEDLPTRPDDDDLDEKSPLVNGCSQNKDLMDEAREDWEMLSAKDRAYWLEQERIHDEKQPEIAGLLEKILQREPKRSAKKLSEDIGYWCGKTTIGKWKNLRFGPTYRKGTTTSDKAPLTSSSSHNTISRSSSMDDSLLGKQPTESVSSTSSVHDDENTIRLPHSSVLPPASVHEDALII
jgi:hypothetical protein